MPSIMVMWPEVQAPSVHENEEVEAGRGMSQVTGHLRSFTGEGGRDTIWLFHMQTASVSFRSIHIPRGDTQVQLGGQGSAGRQGAWASLIPPPSLASAPNFCTMSPAVCTLYRVLSVLPPLPSEPVPSKPQHRAGRGAVSLEAHVTAQQSQVG